MNKSDNLGRGRSLPIGTGVVACVAVLAVVGCGSSGSSSSKSTTTATTASASGRRAQIQNCLKQQGVTLPQRPAGGPPPGGPRGFGFGGGGAGGGRFANPKVRAALQKCGITARPGGFGRNSPAFRAALTKFASCMSSNGYPLPAPNFSGTGPIFRTGKINQNDPKFRSAYAKCRTTLSFRRRPGAGGGPGGAM